MARLKYNLDEIKTFIVTPGRYRARLLKVEQTISSTKKPMLVWFWKIVSGEEKGTEIRSYTSLQENALTNLKNHLEAFGLKGKVNTSTDRLVGKYAVLVVDLGINKSGKEASNITAVFSDKPQNLSDEGEETEEEDVEDEEEAEEDGEETEEEAEEDENEDEEEEDEEEPEEKPARRTVSRPAQRTAKKVLAKKAPRGKLPF